MSIDPFFLFTEPGNLAALLLLLEPEKFEVIEVKKSIGPCNNTIAIVDILQEDEDIDGLPIIVKSGVRRELMYDRTDLTTALKLVLPMEEETERLYVEIESGSDVDVYTVLNALRNHGIDVGDDAITVNPIKTTDVIEIITTSKSIRFSGRALIALKYI